MQQTVRTRLQRNADYHAAMAEYFANLRDQKENENGNGDHNGNGRERATLEGTHAMTPRSPITASLDDLKKLIEMHDGAAEQLQALLADEKPESIVKERAFPPVVRKTGPVLPMRIGAPRQRMH